MEYQNVLVLTDFSKDSEEAGKTAEKVLRRSPISVFVTRK